MSEFKRVAEHEVLDLIIKRWSARAMSGRRLDQKILNQLFEAAKWAPSCYNVQPWRFVYAHKGSTAWQKMYDLQVDFNKKWTINSSVLVLVISYKLFPWNKEPNHTHSFDTGSAVQNMCLQATSLNLVIHGMAGFDYDKARKEFKIPNNYNIEAMYAIGYPADKEVLPTELQDKEVLSDRNKINSFCFEDDFKELQHEQSS